MQAGSTGASGGENGGIVYVLTNVAMPGYVKIGKTDNLEGRLRDLDWTNLPLPFECIYAARVKDATFVETQLFEAFADSRVRARREFFIISPERVVAALRLAETENVTPGQPAVENEAVRHDLEKERARRAVFNFELAHVPVDAVLTFTRDEKVTATVVDSRHVNFNGQVTSLSEAARLALVQAGFVWRAAQGPLYWQYEGQTLDERRRGMEEGE